jgi:hypothetical protein
MYVYIYMYIYYIYIHIYIYIYNPIEKGGLKYDRSIIIIEEEI